MASHIANIALRIVRLTFTVKLASLITFIVIIVSYKRRIYLSSFINRLFSAKTRPFVVFVIGNSSTDKDTFVTNLTRDFDLQHISVEPWLNSLLGRQDEIGALARKYHEKRIPVPTSHIVPLLRAHINELRDRLGTCRFLIDGFPLSKEGAQLWNKKMGKPDVTLYLDTPKRKARVHYTRYDSLGVEDEEMIIQRRFDKHEREKNGWPEDLNQGDYIQVTVPDDSNKSYAKALDTLRKDRRSAVIFV